MGCRCWFEAHSPTVLPFARLALSAVVYLLPHEASYVDFLRVRKIPLQQAPLSQQLPDLQSALQRQSETDRWAGICQGEGLASRACFCRKRI